MSLTIRQRPEGVAIDVAGEVDLATAPRLRDLLTETVRAAPAVELDLREVTFIDCVGARAVRRAQRAAERSGCRLLVHRSPIVHRLDRLLGEIAPAHA